MWSSTCLLIPGFCAFKSIYKGTEQAELHCLQLWIHKNSVPRAVQLQRAIDFSRIICILLFKKNFLSQISEFPLPAHCSFPSPHLSMVCEGALRSAGNCSISPKVQPAPFIPSFQGTESSFLPAHSPAWLLTLRSTWEVRPAFWSGWKLTKGVFLKWDHWADSVTVQPRECKCSVWTGAQEGDGSLLRALGWLNPAALLHHLWRKNPA